MTVVNDHLHHFSFYIDTPHLIRHQHVDTDTEFKKIEVTWIYHMLVLDATSIWSVGAS